MSAVVKWVEKKIIKPVGYFFSGTYHGTNGNDNIWAASLNLGWGKGILTKNGDDTVHAAAFHLKVKDDYGRLTVHGAGGYTEIYKYKSGDLTFYGASGGLKIEHTGWSGNVNLRSVAVSSTILRKGYSGNVDIWSAAAHTSYKLYTKYGNLVSRTAAAYMNLDRRSNGYGGSSGHMRIYGAGAWVKAYSDVEYGDMTGYTLNGNGTFKRYGRSSSVDLRMAGINNKIYHHSERGNTKVYAIGGRNYIEKKSRYSWHNSRGDLTAYLGGLRNNVYSDVRYGNIIVGGAAISSKITRIGDEGNARITGLGIDNQIDIHMQKGHLTYVGAAASNRIYIRSRLWGSYWWNSNYSANVGLVGLYNKVTHDTGRGDLVVTGGGGYTEVKRYANIANLTTNLGGIKNNVYLRANHGNFTFNGAGAANILKNDSKNGYTSVIAAGIGNSLTRNGNGDGNIIMLGGGNHISWTGRGNLKAKLGGLTINHLTRRGDGNNEFTLLGLVGNIVNIYGNGNVVLGGLGLTNVIKKEGNGDASIILVGGANIYHQKGNGSIKALMLGGANVLLKRNHGGNIYALMAGGVNYIGQVDNGNLYAGMLGGANVITKFGQGDAYALMAGGLNVLVHVGNGTTAVAAYGGYNISTKVGTGLSIGAMFGAANVFTHVGDGHSIGLLVGGLNLFTKVGGRNEDHTIGVLIGGGNIFTHIGHGSTFGFMAGGVNLFTKVGNGLTLAAMFSAGNIFTHIGDGMTGALMVGKGNVLTKVGDGLSVGVMLGTGNIFTHVGHGSSLALMVASGNIFTKVGGKTNDYTIAAMLGAGNVFTHVGGGVTGAVTAGLGNIITKVGDGPALAVMLAPPKEAKITVGNIFTHVGNGISGALMFGGHANIFTKVGNGLSVAAMIGGYGNIFTHVGDGPSVALMVLSKANVFTKVGDGLTLAFMQGKANIMTHVGNGATVGLAIGTLNIITKIGNDELAVGLYGKANIVTHVSNEKSNTFALVKGNLNVITKIGPLDGLSISVSPLDGIVSDPVAKEDRILARGDITKNPNGFLDSAISGIDNLISSTYNDVVSRKGGMLAGVVIGDANIITHVGKGSTNLIAHGKANIITKVGNGRSIILSNGKANIITTVGNSDSITLTKGEANIVTKVGSGSNVVLAKGKANIITKIGDGLHIGLMYGKANVQTVVGDGMSISGQVGDFNINTKVGNGTNISVVKGKYNLNVQFGDGLGIAALAGRGNISIKIGNGDYYGATIETGKRSAKDTIKSLLSEIKGTGVSVLASGTISRIVNGKDASGVSHGHTTPNVQTPTNLKGIDITQSQDKTTSVNKNEYSLDVTRTQQKGNSDSFSGVKKEDSKIVADSQTQSQTATDANANAQKDKNKLTQDINKSQDKVNKEKQKVTSFQNDIQKSDEEKLKQNANEIKSFISSQLGDSSNSQTNNPKNQIPLSKNDKNYENGSSLRAEFETMNSNVKTHLDKYGKKAQDALKEANTKSSQKQKDIQDSMSGAKDKYGQAYSNEQKAKSDSQASQADVSKIRTQADKRKSDANSAKNDANKRANSASNGSADKRKSDAKGKNSNIGSSFDAQNSAFKGDKEYTPSNTPAGLDQKFNYNKLDEELKAGIEALRANTRKTGVNHSDKINSLKEKFAKAKDTVKNLNELRKEIKKAKKEANIVDAQTTKYNLEGLPNKQLVGDIVEYNGESLASIGADDVRYRLHLLGERQSSASFDLNVDDVMKSYLPRQKNIISNELTTLKYTQEQLETLKDSGKIKDIKYGSAAKSRLTFKIVDPDSGDTYTFNGIKDENGKFSISTGGETLKVFNGYKKSDVELDANDVRNLVNLDYHLKATYFTDRIELKTINGVEYTLRKNSQNNKYSIYKTENGKSIKLTYTEHPYTDGVIPRIALDEAKQKQLKSIDFEKMFNNVVNEEVRAQNGKAVKLHDGLPMYVAQALEKDNIKLEVYEMGKDGTYKEVLKTENSLTNPTTLRVIREGESGNFSYHVYNKTLDPVTGLAVYTKEKIVGNKNNSLYEAIDAQLNKDNYERVLTENGYELKAKPSAKDNITDLRAKTAEAVDSTYDAMAKEVLKEMDIGSLKLSYKDQFWAIAKSVLLQKGISALVKNGLKEGLSFVMPKIAATLIARIVSAAVHTFIAEFILTKDAFKPDGVKTIEPRSSEGKLLTIVTDTLFNVVGMGAAHAFLTTPVNHGLADITGGDTQNQGFKLWHSTSTTVAGDEIATIAITALKVKLAKEGIYKIADKEVDAVVKKAFKDGSNIGKKIAVEKLPSASTSAKDHARSFLNKYIERAGGYLVADIVDVYTQNEYKGELSPDSFLDKMLSNGVKSGISKAISTSLGRTIKYSIEFAPKDGGFAKAKDLVTVIRKHLAKENTFIKDLKASLIALDKTTPLTQGDVDSIQRFYSSIASDVISSFDNFKNPTSEQIRLRQEILIRLDYMMQRANSFDDTHRITDNERGAMKTELSSLKSQINSFKNTIPSDNKHKKVFDNSLNLVESIDESVRHKLKKTKVLSSVFNKNEKVIIDEQIIKDSKVADKTYVSIEKVYFDDNGKKVVLKPHLDIPAGSDVINVRQYGKRFVLVENGKEKAINGQSDSVAASDNLKVLLKRSQNIDIDKSKLSKLITTVDNFGSDTVAHLSDTKPYKESGLDSWKQITQTQKQILSEVDDAEPMKNHDHQVIVQLEDGDTPKESAYKLALKHPNATTIIYMSKDGSIKHIYGKELSKITGDIRISTVGHGRTNADKTKTMGGRDINSLASNIQTLKNRLTKANVKTVNLVGCNLGTVDHIDDTKKYDYGKNLIKKLGTLGIKSEVHVRNAYLAIDEFGRKITSEDGLKTSQSGEWRNKNTKHKTVYGYDKDGNVVKHISSVDGDLVSVDNLESKDGLNTKDSNRLISDEYRNINDVDLNNIGDSIKDNNVDFKPKTSDVVDTKKINDLDKKISSINTSNNKKINKKNFDKSIDDAKKAKKTTKQKLASIGANIQINIGDGEHSTLYWGSNNIDIKLGNGGHKTAMVGDNNALISIGNRSNNSAHTVSVGNYTAFEGAQLFIGQRNVAFNYGDRNDFIVMLDKSIPVIPLLNPFDGAAGIAQTLKKMASANSAEQEELWSFEKAKTFSTSLSTLDITSSVKYETILDVGSQNDVSGRGIKYDAEAYLNNKINSGGDNKPVSKEKMKKMSFSDKQKAKLKNAKSTFANTSINFTVAGRGSDIILANGNFSFIFADNVQSVLDTTVASLFGVMQQGFSSTGAPTSTFTFSPADLKTQIGNNIKNRLASLTDDITVGEVMDYAYTQNGHVYSKDGKKVDVTNMVSELFTTILDDSYKSLLGTMQNPKRVLNTVKAMGNTAGDMIKNGLSALGLPIKTKDENKDAQAPTPSQSSPEESTKSFGFSGLKMPSFFDILKIPTMITKMPELVNDLASSLSSDVDNMKGKFLEFFTKSGYMKDDGDLVVSLGSQNFVWGGHGDDIIALLGVNNNVWAGKGDDTAYLMGEGNTFSGNSGNDTAIMMGQNHMGIGGSGDDFFISSGRYNNIFGGSGKDTLWAFGTRGLITGGEGDDYIVATGNNHDVNAGIGDDFNVTIGSGNKVYLEDGNDQAKLFGNKNKLVAGKGRDTLDIYAYDSVIEGGDDNDIIMSRAKSKNNEIYGQDGKDTLFMGGYKNKYTGGKGADIFVVTKQNIEAKITDIESNDIIVFNNFKFNDLWFEKSSNDLIIHNYNGAKTKGSQDWFEEYGAVNVDNYFKQNEKDRARIVTSVKTDAKGDVIGYEYLDNNAFDKLIEIMATADKTKGKDGFMTKQSDRVKNQVELAWSQRHDQIVA